MLLREYAVNFSNVVARVGRSSHATKASGACVTGTRAASSARKKRRSSAERRSSRKRPARSQAERCKRHEAVERTSSPGAGTYTHAAQRVKKLSANAS